LSWQAPTQQTDGSALTDLGGYVIKLGTSASSLTTNITLASGAITQYTVTDLSVGTWYFAVVAYAADGTESDVSEVVTKTIR
jgi:hypothetical protein